MGIAKIKWRLDEYHFDQTIGAEEEEQVFIATAKGRYGPKTPTPKYT